jgi:hypothetical protein
MNLINKKKELEKFNLSNKDNIVFNFYIKNLSKISSIEKFNKNKNISRENSFDNLSIYIKGFQNLINDEKNIQNNIDNIDCNELLVSISNKINGLGRHSC